MTVRETDNLCVCCGSIIPEGMQICPIYFKEFAYKGEDDESRI